MHQKQRQEVIWRKHNKSPFDQAARKDIFELLNLLQDETFYEEYCQAYISSAKDGMEPTLNQQLKKEVLAQDF